MSTAVSRGQALQISARVATQVNWDELDDKRLQQDIIELTPEEFGKRMTAFLLRGAKWPTWKKWRTVKYGAGLEKGADFLAGLKKKLLLTDGLEQLLNNSQIEVASEAGEAIVILATPADLYFPGYEDVLYDDVLARGVSFGLELCSLEISLQFLLQINDLHALSETGFYFAGEHVEIEGEGPSYIGVGGRYIFTKGLKRYSSRLLRSHSLLAFVQQKRN